MPATFFGMNIARTGMLTYNTWLNTTGHNIANVKTEGYTKQTVRQEAIIPIKVGTTYGMMGAGVEAVSVDSQRDVYYDKKYRLSNTEYGKYETESIYLKDIEDVLYAKTSESGAITNTMDLFLKSLSELADDSANVSIRKQVVGYADLLLQNINEAADRLKEIQKDVNSQIADVVDQINAYAQEIASVTQQINTLEVYGSMASDLRDQRALLLDKLSELVDVNVTEKEPRSGTGIRQYIVSIDNAVLVDTYDVNLLRYQSRDTYNALNDIDNLYDLRWSSGQDFGIHDKGLGGKLQALFELRDGNNGEVVTGKVKSAAKGASDVKVEDVNDVGSSLFKLELPATDGILTIGHTEYEYKSFECTVDGEGKYTYTFHLKDPLAAEVTNEDAHVSDAVDFRGIPYYMSQLDEFIRTFSYHFNEVQTGGYDLNDAKGTQMFISRDKVDDVEQNFSFDLYDFSFESDTGEVTAGASLTDWTSAPRAGYEFTTYYKMTALTASVDSKILADGKLLAASDEAGSGVSNGKNLEKMSALRDKKTMFLEGEPASFLKILASKVGIDSKKIADSADNAKNIKDSTESRRMSVAGVDEDEEAQNLILCQNLLNYQYKVLSVMNETLDKLINGTAI